MNFNFSVFRKNFHFFRKNIWDAWAITDTWDIWPQFEFGVNIKVNFCHAFFSSKKQPEGTEKHCSPPKFKQVINAYRVKSADRLTLVVEVYSHPAARFQWFCNDVPVGGGSDSEEESSSRKLALPKQCVARHSINVSTLTVEVSVLERYLNDLFCSSLFWSIWSWRWGWEGLCQWSIDR